MESAHKRFLFTGWDASKNYLVRYTHSFVFAMHRNSWIKIVHVHFTWNNLCFLQDPRVSKKRSRYYTPGKELPHMRCFNCNEKGHLSQFCPEPKVHTFSWYLPFRYIWFFWVEQTERYGPFVFPLLFGNCSFFHRIILVLANGTM